MQIAKIETLIDDMDLTIMVREAELSYLEDLKTRLSIQVAGVSKEQEKADADKLIQITQGISQKEEEIKSLKFVNNEYAKRLAKERSQK